MSVAADPTTTTRRLLDGLTAERTCPLAEHRRQHGPVPDLAPGGPGRAGQLVPEVEAAGLRGRGGGWFPTGRKMIAVTQAATPRRTPVAIANGMEGEPASSKDAVLLALAPHLVLDGLVLAARAIGARSAIVAVHRGSPAERVLEAALAERAAAGGDLVRLSLAAPPARYVASEESALAHWVGDGVARPRHGARPFERGVAGRPTLVQNVETLAHVALIARRGASWFRSAGDPGAPGTTLVTVGGAVASPGVIEVPTGTPVGELLDRCGGPTEPLAAFLTGGYGGAWTTIDLLGVPWAPDAVRGAGGVIGAGILVALPASTCGLEETARVTRWMAGESAGQCGPCRFGLAAVADDLDVLCRAGAGPEDLARLRGRLGLVAGRGACKHPDGVARLVASALDVFAQDVGHHLHGRCSATRRGAVLPVPQARPTPAPTAGKDWR